ncbi:MAG: hypothetical protein KDA87_06660 [Planctomycetales bacterium]|nr:hypothetical protein [Planctomycetales bacterium]
MHITSISALIFFWMATACVADDTPVTEASNSSPPVQDIVDVSLPSEVSQMDVGGNGRYLLLYFRELRKIGVVDIRSQTITGYIPATDDQTKFAAGASKIVVVSPESKVIAQYDLATLNQEKLTRLELDANVAFCLLGAASNGPAIFGLENTSVVEVALDTFQTKKVTQVREFFRKGYHLNISANGNLITSMAPGARIQTLAYHLGQWQAYSIRSQSATAMPSANGEFVYCSFGVYRHDLTKVRTEPFDPNKPVSLLASVNGPFALRIRPTLGDLRADRPATTTVDLLLEDTDLEVKELAQLENQFPWDARRLQRSSLPLDKRIVFVPSEELVAVLTEDSLKLIPLDAWRQLQDNANDDFLFVTSTPPNSVNAGETFDYPILVKTNLDELQYKLESGPEEAEISSDGRITWKTSTSSNLETPIIVSISDETGLLRYHSFVVRVVGGDRNGWVKTPLLVVQNQGHTEDGVHVIKLPSQIDNVTLGGGGRYVFLTLNAVRKVAVLDLSKKSVVTYLATNEDRTVVAAGKNFAFVFSPKQGIVQRYRLDSLELDITKSTPFPYEISTAQMGSDSDGPIIVTPARQTHARADRISFLDVDSLTVQDMTWDAESRNHTLSNNSFSFVSHVLHVSANGQAFTIDDEPAVFRLANSQVEHYDAIRFFGKRLSADGRYIFAGGRVMANAKERIERPSDPTVALPAVSSHYYLTIPVAGELHMIAPCPVNQAKLHVIGTDSPLLTIQKKLIPVPSDPDQNTRLRAWHKRLWLVPILNTIVSVPFDGDQVWLHDFDIEAELKNSKIDFLFVDSVPPPTLEPGETFQYSLSVQSKHGQVKCKLDSGPPGMTCTESGTIAWHVPNDIRQPRHDVLVSISDASGQSVFHSFTLQIPAVQSTMAEMQTTAAASEKERAQEAKIAALSQALKIAQTPVFQRRLLETPAFNPTMKSWTDVSEKHTVSGVFVEIRDKSQVVIRTRDGRELAIALNKLKTTDLYEAVRLDVLKEAASGRARNPRATPSESPFQPVKP